MRTRYYIYIALALLVSFLIYNKFYSEKGRETMANNASKGAKRKTGPVPVVVMIAKDTTLDNSIDVTGTIDANERVNLTSETAGNITGIYFKEGTRVQKGQLLVKVYNQDLEAALKQNEYQVVLAKQNEYRNGILLQKEAISKQEYDTSLTSLNTLKAQGDVIKAQISKTEIRAPFSGTIGLRNVSPGGYLSPGTTIASLVNIDPAKITFSVPERYLSLIRIGSRIDFGIESATQKFTAHVYAIEPAIDLNSRTVTVRAEAPNPKGLLTAGGFAKINLTLNQVAKTMMIPTQCVIPDLKSSIVYVYHHGTALAKPVQTDLRTDTRIQVIKGLDPGDSVVVSGIIQMRPNVPLHITRVIK